MSSQRPIRFLSMSRQRLLLIGYCVFALLINFIPFVSIPFIYLTTVFHELSHGIATLLTGGTIKEFALAANGSGHLISYGGLSVIIAFSGYFGAALWGGLLYHSARHVVLGRLTLLLLITAFSITLLLWVNTLTTALILVMVIGLLLAVLVYSKNKVLDHIIRFIGVLVLFNAIYSPLYLLGSKQGDSAILANLIFVPPIIWIALWLFWGLFVLYQLFKSTK